MYAVLGISGVIKMKYGIWVVHTFFLLDDDFDRMGTLPSSLLLDASDDSGDAQSTSTSSSEVESSCSRITNSFGRPFLFGFLLRLSTTLASLSSTLGGPGI